MSELDAVVDEVCGALESYGQHSLVAMAGVPATGKSHVANLAAAKFSRHPFFITSIQFHSGFSYEDFVEGYRPLASGGFELRDGVLLTVNQQALRDPTNKYILLIEEITRANTSAVLGELLTYIEHRERSFQLPSGRRVRLAQNLYLLATFNPLDRTALELDDAVIRRLRVVSVRPSGEHIESLIKPSNDREKAFALAMKEEFRDLAAKLETTRDEGLPFGHAVFKGIKTELDLRNLWNQQLDLLLRRPGLPPHPTYESIQGFIAKVEARMGAFDATPVSSPTPTSGTVPVDPSTQSAA